MAKKAIAAKKRVVKIDGVGQLHVMSSFNNVIPWQQKEYSVRSTNGSS